MNEEEEKSGSEVGGRRDQERCEEEEGGILSPQSATGEPFFLLISLSCASTSALRPSVRPSVCPSVRPPSGSWRKLTSVLGVLSLSPCLPVWVCSLAQPPCFSSLFFFGCESELMPLLRHAALFAVQGFSSANSTSTAAASGGSTAAQTPQNPGRARSCGSDGFHVTASESLMD